MRVLVVDDEVRLADNIARALREGAGYAVDVAHDGKDALQFCRSSHYDLIVLDLMIPHVSGEKVVQQVRAARLASPILVLTAVSETGKTIDLLNLGADDYMTKPFDLGELIARARALIRRAREPANPSWSSEHCACIPGSRPSTCMATRVELSPTEYPHLSST